MDKQAWIAHNCRGEDYGMRGPFTERRQAVEVCRVMLYSQHEIWVVTDVLSQELTSPARLH